MRPLAVVLSLWPVLGGVGVLAGENLPFTHKVEVYRAKEGDVMAFAVRLEQPFLAEEFEKSNYLRLRSADDRAYLIYPQETTFQQKHAEFYGRLRGQGDLKLQLSYEIVSEAPDGARRVQVRQGEITVAVPAEPTGAESLYRQWARQQNLYFAALLRYYPEESFYQYCLLQSPARYGVEPPPLPLPAVDRAQIETNLYQVFTGSHAIQEALQRQVLKSGSRSSDLNVHVSRLRPPELKSLAYKELLEAKRTREQIEPRVAEVAALIPEDQYLLQFNSLRALGEMLDFALQWGGNVQRLTTVQAKDDCVQQKLEDQLCVRRDELARLFGDAVLGETVVTGADPFVNEGSDVTLILRVKQPALFRAAAAGWLAQARQAHPDLAEAEFNYRGHKIAARYTPDRLVSSFVAEHQEYVIYSNSHRAVRRSIDAATGAAPALRDALDYRYVTTLLPPAAAANAGYFFIPEAMIRRMVGPAWKISEKRRLECYNNLVMLNNASLFYRLEAGRSPRSLSELIEGRFIDPEKIVCPHGGVYAFDAAHDACTCSLHNRLKYLAPNAELTVLNVSAGEQAEYDRYKQRYEAFWQGLFDPIAVRITVDRRLKLETCVLPMANGSLYQRLRGLVDRQPKAFDTGRLAASTIGSLLLVPGRKAVADAVRDLPGVAEVLRAHPTLADLSWLGDGVGLHVCDGQSILEIDPTELHPLQLPLLGNCSLDQQGIAIAALVMLKMPMYATIDVENREQAGQMLDRLSREVVLKGTNLAGIRVTSDAYRLPDYKQHPLYVFSVQVYAVKLRLHVAVVNDQIALATKPEILRQVIDAAQASAATPVAPAHWLLRFNRQALVRASDDAQLYWEEKARIACHRNISSIFNLRQLYGAPMDQIARLSETKYGVRYFCPDDGDYRFDADHNQVLCTVHGNREQSRQAPQAGRKTSFRRFVEGVDEVTAALRFQDDALLATVEIVRGKPPVAGR